MKALVCNEPLNFEYVTIERPALKKDHAIIRIKRIGVCGTDLHAFEGTQPYFTYPRVLGHELAGELVEFDNAPGFLAGEIVTIIPYFNCGECIACRKARPNCCANMQVCGVHVDGGMVEYLSVPSSSLLRSEGMNLDELALVEPLAIAVHGVRRANIEANEFVLVVGAGPIGMGTMEFARIAGAKVIAMDMNEQRLGFCKDKLRVNYTIDASKSSVAEQLQKFTNGEMPTVVIDATGNLTAINNAFQYMAHGGRYVLVGLQKENITFSHPEFHKREGTLLSSRNATREDFEYVIACIKKGLINPIAYITHRAFFADVKKEFQSWLDPAKGVVKAMIEL